MVIDRKKLFISSVQSEFAEERKRLAEYIRQDALFSRYFEPFLFEELPAQDMSAQGAYLEQAAKSEVYLLLATKLQKISCITFGYIEKLPFDGLLLWFFVQMMCS